MLASGAAAVITRSYRLCAPTFGHKIWNRGQNPKYHCGKFSYAVLLHDTFFSQYFTAWKSQCTWAGTLGHSTSTAMTKMHTLPRLFKWWSKGWLQHVWFPPQFPPWYYLVTSFHLFGLTGRFNINVGALMDNSSKSCVVS